MYDEIIPSPGEIHAFTIGFGTAFHAERTGQNGPLLETALMSVGVGPETPSDHEPDGHLSDLAYESGYYWSGVVIGSVVGGSLG